ncbi:MAG: MFS transporter [Acidobacteriota bacterium]
MEDAKARRVGETLRALRHRNYRIYFFCMLVSFTGTWMQSIAQSWLVYRLTESAWLLGLVGFVGQAPVFFFTPLGGVLADRHRRQMIIILTQAASMFQALLLAWLTLTDSVTVAWVVALALVLGIITAFDMPARQSFMIEMVGKEDLMNAIALNSSMINGARIIGPATAGLVVASLGEGLCFLLNAVSYVFVIAGMFALRVESGTEKSEGSALSHLKEGFDFIRSARPVRAVLWLVALVSLFGLPYIVLMPVFARDVLGGGPRALGVMMSAAGAGALAGALTLAARRSSRGLGRVVAASVALFGVMVVLFSISRNLWLSALLLVPAAFAVMLQLSASNTLLQMMVPDNLRGRMMSFYSMSLIGVTPFGSLLAGAVASRIGAPGTLALGGVICFAGAIIFFSRLEGLRQEAAIFLGQSET